MMRYIISLAFLMSTHAVSAQDYIRCSDANKLCNGYELQISATNKYCDGAKGICETAPGICSHFTDMCSKTRDMQLAAKDMCDAVRAACK